MAWPASRISSLGVTQAVAGHAARAGRGLVSRPQSFGMIGSHYFGPDGDPLAGWRAAQQRCCAGRQPGPRGDSESVESDAGGDQGGKRAEDREQAELPAPVPGQLNRSWTAHLPDRCLQAAAGRSARAGVRRPLEIAAARAVRGRGIRAGQLGAEPGATDGGVVQQHVEPSVSVLTNKPTASLGNLPAPPARFGIIYCVQPHPCATGQADEPGDAEPAGVTYSTGDTGGEAATQAGDWMIPRAADGREQPERALGNLRCFRCVTNDPTGVVFSVQVATVEHVTSPSRWFLRTGGVSLGRCGSTGPAVFPGFVPCMAGSAVRDWLRSWNAASHPAWYGRDACACAEWKRTQ